MAEVTLTDEQLASLAEQLGVETEDGDEVSVDKVLEAAAARKAELDTAKREAEEAERRANEQSEDRVKQLENEVADTSRRLFERERTDAIKQAQREGRLSTKKDEVEKWERRFESPEKDGLGFDKARALLFEQKVDDELVREFGREPEADEVDERVKAHEAEIARNVGVSVEQLI